MIPIETSITKVNKIFGCDVFSPTRERNNVDGRMALIIFFRRDFKYSLEKIGKIFGKNHATIIHHLKRHDDYMKFNKEYRDKFLELSDYKTKKRWLCIECNFKIRTYDTKK